MMRYDSGAWLRTQASCPTRREAIAGAALATFAGATPTIAASPNPARIVCIGGAITEILYALGSQRNIVAIDSTSQYPPAALKEKRNVGYMRSVSAEGVLAMRPTLILAMADAGPPTAIETLRESGIALVRIDDTLSPAAVVGRVQKLAALVGAEARGRKLVAEIGVGFRKLGAYRREHPAHKRVLFVLSLQNGRPMVAGKGTAADSIIALAGGINAAATLEGYKPIGDEALAMLAPDAVLAMEHAGPSMDASALDAPGFQLTPAGRRHALIRMDGSYLLGLGPRTPLAALDLARRLNVV